MNYDGVSKIFIFADESGDVGDPLVKPDSSRCFVVNFAVATEEGVTSLEMLASGFKFFNLYKKELKYLRGKGLKNFSHGIGYLTNVVFYEIVIDKTHYTGPYLRGVDNSVKVYSPNPHLFRNFILKIGLEHIVTAEKLFRFEDRIELVIDRYLFKVAHEENLKKYLAQYARARLPKFLHVTQVDSRYCLPIQVLDMVQKTKNVGAAGVNFCEAIPVPLSLQNGKGPVFPLGPVPNPRH